MTEPLDRHLRRVTRINGCEVHVSQTGIFFDAYDPETGEVMATTLAKDPKLAAQRLVELVYQINSNIVMEQQAWKCNLCQLRRPLQAHHKIHRSKGRSDRVDNLEALCHKCHAEKHGG